MYGKIQIRLMHIIRTIMIFYRSSTPSAVWALNTFFIGLDAQIPMRPGCEGITGPKGLASLGTGSDRFEERHGHLLDIMRQYKLFNASTFSPQEDVTTFQPHGRDTTQRKQLDHLLVSDCCRANSGVLNHLHLHGDHFPAWSSVALGESVRIQVRKFCPNYCGWRPLDAFQQEK